MNVTESIINVGAYDKDLDLFEGQYPLRHGVTYHSYVILDQKIAILDTVDQRAQSEWLEHLEKVLNEKVPDYLIVSHMEPDHGACIQVLCEKYPEITIVGNVKTFMMIDEYFELPQTTQRLVVKEGDTLKLGHHILQFIMAPMVHWPEVMMSYEKTNQILFSADAFGTFEDENGEWLPEARRYYTNIVGKYGIQVQNVLKKAATLEIAKICPLHGPILEADLEKYMRYYQLWSTYTPEESGVLIACASIYGHTMEAALELKKLLEEAGETVVLYDVCRTDPAEIIADMFRYDRLVLAASSYDGGVFAPMETLIAHMKGKNLQNRCIGFIENGSWAPSAYRTMKASLDTMKNMEYVEPVVTIKGAMKEKDCQLLKELAQNICKGGCQNEICM